MRTLKNKDRAKYLKDRETTQKILRAMRMWKSNSPINLLDSTYKVASFFHTYYTSFQKKSAARLVSLQHVKDNPTDEAAQTFCHQIMNNQGEFEYFKR